MVWDRRHDDGLKRVGAGIQKANGSRVVWISDLPPNETARTSRRHFSNERCGEDAIYCARCDLDYQKFLPMLGNEYW